MLIERSFSFQNTINALACQQNNDAMTVRYDAGVGQMACFILSI
jgi:hypothetical protein